MPLEPGQKLASYEILAPLGAGGMGEVWRARDTRLGRDVAIKALPDAFARDPERLARFEREAKLLASVNHANIGAIYGLEVVDGHRYLVLEFLEGETLSAVLSRGPLPVPEAIEICGQVAGALEAAHEAGIVHRDLKPGNVMLLRTGAVKVLDFGLAKADGGPGSSSDIGASASPTMTYGATQAGMVLGTAAYMSPEQARGRAVDKRTDIWSFGCVLYECLTGRQAFEGETVSDLIVHILTSEPDWNLLPPATPPRVRDLLRRCLEKDARRRMRDMGDARIELEETLAPRGSSYAVPTSIAAGVDAAAAKPKRKGIGLELFAAVAGAVAAVLATKLVEPMLGSKKAARLDAKFQIVASDTMQIVREGANIALSPDGKTICFSASDSTGNAHLWVRALNTLAPRPLSGTEGGFLPFFSPDGQSIGFFTDTKLKRVSVATGDIDVLADVKRARGGAWNKKDQIVYAPTSDGPMFMISAAGGEAKQVTTLLKGETGHRGPCFLPDGNHFLYSSLPPRLGRYTIRVAALSGGKADSIAALGGGVRYAAPGWLLYQTVIGLWGQKFDPGRRRAIGQPVPLRENAQVTSLAGVPGLAVGNGMIAFQQFTAGSSRLVWIDREGHETGTLPFPVGQYTGDMAFSPDGRKLAYGRALDVENVELWIGDVATGGETRFATEPVLNEGPLWSPDGSRVAYLNSQAGPQTIVIKPLNGGPARKYLEKDVSFKRVDSWTPDGKRLVFERQDPATRWDLWILEVESGTAKPLLVSPFNEQGAKVSPDGRWMTYTAEETGRGEVYVQPFEAPGQRVQITTGGGIRSLWSDDGRQLVYQTVQDPLAVRTADILPGDEFKIGPPRISFRVPASIETGDVTHDGRIAIQVPAGKPVPGGVTVITDWTSLLRRR